MIGLVGSTPKVCGGSLGFIDRVQTMNGPFLPLLSILGVPPKWSYFQTGSSSCTRSHEP